MRRRTDRGRQVDRRHEPAAPPRTPDAALEPLQQAYARAVLELWLVRASVSHGDPIAREQIDEAELWADYLHDRIAAVLRRRVLAGKAVPA